MGDPLYLRIISNPRHRVSKNKTKKVCFLFLGQHQAFCKGSSESSDKSVRDRRVSFITPQDYLRPKQTSSWNVCVCACGAISSFCEWKAGPRPKNTVYAAHCHPTLVRRYLALLRNHSQKDECRLGELCSLPAKSVWRRHKHTISYIFAPGVEWMHVRGK